MSNKKGNRRLRSGFRIFFKLIVLGIIVYFGYRYISNIHIKNIYITGNNYVSDVEIIETAGIKDYPKIFKLNKKNLIKKISSIPLVSSVNIKRNIFGKLTIEIVEDKVLFYYQYEDKYVTSSNKLIDDDNYYGIPTIINFTPDTIFDELVTSFNKLDDNVIKLINEIEYSPYKSSEGEIIDDGRFNLYMNDGNTVVIDLVNIKKLNDYTKIFASLELDTKKGTLYLDTITEENIYFKEYGEEIIVEEETSEEGE